MAFFIRKFTFIVFLIDISCYFGYFYYFCSLNFTNSWLYNEEKDTFHHESDFRNSQQGGSSQSDRFCFGQRTFWVRDKNDWKSWARFGNCYRSEEQPCRCGCGGWRWRNRQRGGPLTGSLRYCPRHSALRFGQRTGKTSAAPNEPEEMHRGHQPMPD